MEAYLLDWASLLARWLHLITGIAWIGASFYFIWLDNHLEVPKSRDNPRLTGEIWAIHGGGFYHNQKYLLGPAKLPETLHWFKWEAYFTWMSGMLVLGLVYWASASAYLIDKSVADLSVGAAIAISAGVLVAGWVVYDVLCRLIKSEWALGVVVYVALVAASWGLAQVFSARAAYIHVGAIIGTIMVWNVFFIIMPGQRKMVAAIMRGETPDPAPGLAGKQRSVHNNYFTLPVLFIMISNHYPMTYGNTHGWLVLAVIMGAAVLIRHFFNLRHKGRTVWGYPIAALMLLAGVAAAIAPAKNTGGKPEVSMVRLQTVLNARCVACHSAKPTQPGFVQPPAGLILDSPDRIRSAALKINQQVVVGRVMPPGNLTGLTDDERALIADWFAQGAK